MIQTSDKAGERICFYERIARRKLGVGVDWRWCTLNAIGPDAVKVEGGVPRLLKSGQRKGQPTWRDTPLQACIVTTRDLEEERTAYENTTGRCWECLGTKQVVASVSATEGSKYKECRRCGATGLSRIGDSSR